MRWNTVLFDLDGTLTDPGVGITKAVQYALRHYGIDEPDRRKLEKFIGPPLHLAFTEYYGFEPEQALEAVEKFREYYNVTGWRENAPYEGIRELLQDLREAGIKLVIATSKPETTALRVLELFSLKDAFDCICGAPMHDAEASKKAAVIRRALRDADITDLSRAIMVGDRRHDIEGAHETGLAAIGVLYGYGDRAEHTAAGADYLAENMQALRALLLT
ncbi:MAG: HAD hydrolase-like protein [Oscillospiraceae bacterium]|nr:HAD hydrolase-like protein [Oscillospiraceae bacterium]